ncbi:hypothetical protein Rsub_07269 [Raphidocelis subcapitata]|uniref:MYND-type domain-containing protein n=1 Tax=Raphidocelis subcapitata TaxID=307507 RepID=A0A2V0P298_9CHLO|nr:hypothetical protein Rsub_07269 [Raphidocelis subcapitata]|eukprot:GBF94001.1 hypothetical protein Rsub_07269 [Raphidocelis subcapitata]
MQSRDSLSDRTQMADIAAAAPAAARERLAADLRELGAALSRKAQPGLAPEVQELSSSCYLRCRALLDAADSAEGGLAGATAAAAAAATAAELLQPLLSGAFVSAHPDLFALTAEAVGSALLLCRSTEASAGCFGPVATSLLDLFLTEQLSWQIRRTAAEPLVTLLAQRDCAACLLAAPSAASAVDALIAAAKRDGEPQQDSAFTVLAALALVDAATAERASSPEAALLPIAVECIRSIAAHRPQGSMGRSGFGPLQLLWVFGTAAPDAVRTRARAAPGLAGAIVDLFMALGSEEWAAWREELGATCVGLEAEIVFVLAGLLSSPLSKTPAFAAVLSSPGVLPRLLALLRSPFEQARIAASFCISEVAFEEAGCAALFNVPRAASELAAALRRAHLDGEDPVLTQCHAACALMWLIYHSEGWRVAEALVRAAAAEGSGGSLLGALAGLIAASVDESAGSIDLQWRMCVGGVALLDQMRSVATAEQLRVLRQVPRLAAACVGALEFWLTEDTDQLKSTFAQLLVIVAALAGFNDDQLEGSGAQPPAATAETAAARVALRGAPGVEGTLRRLLSQQPPSEDAYMEAVLAAEWLLRLPEVKAAAATAPTPAAMAAVAAAAPTAADPALAAPMAAQARAQAQALAAAVPPSAEAGGRSAAAQPPVPAAGSGGGKADDGSGGGTSSGSSGSSGSGGSGAASAASPRACAGCGKSAVAEAPLLRCVGCKAQYYCGDACALAHWPSHRAACKAARSAAAQRS